MAQFLPHPERQGEIKFYLAKSLSYHMRLMVIFFLLMFGMLVQLFLHKVVFGLPFLLAGTLLSLVRGYTNKPGKTAGGKEDWKPTTLKEIHRIVEMDKKARKWDQSLLDISCVPGFFMLVLVVGVIAGLYLLMYNHYRMWANIFVWDAGVLMLPHWLTGIRSILVNNDLLIKTKYFEKIADYFDTIRKDDEEIRPYLQLNATEDESANIPDDVKMSVVFKDAPEEFLGLQMQITLNNVQGTSFPYFYCVLVARENFGLKNLDNFHKPPNVITEFKVENDVEIFVIRQHTTKTSGYHCKPATAKAILKYSVVLGREALKTAATTS
ncbi:hypothetical protein ACFL54_00590 [Planctomycetota bacterium]